MDIHLLPDKSVLIQLPIFLSVLFSLSFFVFKPLQKIIALRKERTEKLLAETLAIEERVKKFALDYKGKMAFARESAHQEKEKIRQEGSRQASEMILSARKEVNALIDSSRKKIAEAKVSALKELEKDVPKLAEEILKKIK